VSGLEVVRLILDPYYIIALRGSTANMKESTFSFGLVSSALLDKIDRLFACNVGEYVDLPQLVVVGDQSSGKSSVLEGLTNLPFPRDSGLCTRFATQITFRRSAETGVTVSIIPAKNSTEDHKERVQAWTKTDLQILDASSFASIMTEASH
jgi:Dynamin family